MRAGNLLVVALGGAALLIAVVIAWRGRRLPLLATRELPVTPGRSALDGLRTIAAVVGAGMVAGLLVAGLGGRRFMRVMAATSGDAAQGKLTEAEEIVGDVTFGGSLDFVLFVGLIVPAAAALGYLAFRHFLPGPVLVGGLMFGVILLGTFGIDDPMSPDNVDFEILEPLWLAIIGIALLGVLFGLTFAALASRWDASLPPLSAGWRAVPGHVGLVMALLPPFLVVTAVYVLIRTIAVGRTRPILEAKPVRTTGLVIVSIGTVLAAAGTVAAAAEIL